MATGGKCKYLLYIASADALTNRWRCAANFVRVLCQSEEGDHCRCGSRRLLIELNRSTEQGALQQYLDGKKGTSERHVMVTMVTKTWFKTGF